MFIRWYRVLMWIRVIGRGIGRCISLLRGLVCGSSGSLEAPEPSCDAAVVRSSGACEE